MWAQSSGLRGLGSCRCLVGEVGWGARPQPPQGLTGARRGPAGHAALGSHPLPPREGAFRAGGGLKARQAPLPDHLRAEQTLRLLTEGIVQTPPERCQAPGTKRRARSLSRGLTPHGKGLFPDVQSEPGAALCHSAHPVINYRGEESSACLCACPPRGAAEGKEVASRPPCLQCPQPLLPGHALQPFY